MDNIFSSNISQRAMEGSADNRQWKVVKQFILWFFIVIAVISYIGNNGGRTYDEDIYKCIIFFGIFFIIFTAKFLNVIDNSINFYINRKVEFYYTAYNRLADKYTCTEKELQILKYSIEKLQRDNKLKSAYIIPIGMYTPPIILFFVLIALVSIGFGYKPDETENNLLNASPFIIFIIYVLCLAVPLKKRGSIWYSINTDEKQILDEISTVLINNKEINTPVSIEIEKKFDNPYFIILIISIITVAGYVVADTTLASQEKTYLKMIYPVEDRLMEILN